MNRGIIITALLLLTISLASAEIIFPQQPQRVYNFGEGITVPFTVKTLTDTSGTLNMNLICNAQEINFYKNGVILSAGEEKRLEASLVLIKDNIGTLKGSCVIKATLGQDYTLTNDFTISDYVTITSNVKTPEVSPGEYIVIDGNAAKQSGKGVNGFLELNVYEGDSTNATPYLTQMETISNGFFTLNISAPIDMKAGSYTVTIKAYEKDTIGDITNQGSSENSLNVKQVAKNLEIVIENSDVEPGTSMMARVLLHDQTGENIITNSTISIKDSSEKLLEKKEVLTDEYFEFPTLAQQPPEEFKISASAEGLTTDLIFKIKEKADIKLEIVNKTLVVTNTGNVPYCNKSILIRIGGSPLNINPCLEVGKEQKYVLSAPDGEWEIEVITDGQDALRQKATLTGGAVGIQEASQGIVSISRYPFVWIFIIGIMGFIAFMIFKKGSQRMFIGRIFKKQTSVKDLTSPEPKSISLGKKSLIKSKNKAELSLSIKGEKQNASIVAIRMKNLGNIEASRTLAEETLQKAVNFAEDRKALTYENYNDIFFILAPGKTKTFQNEKTAVEIANKIKELLISHNKLAREKIDFGISLNHGTIVGKQEETFKFMSMGTLITSSKKLANHAHEEILIGEKFKDKLPANVRTEKHTADNMNYYKITEIRGGNADHEKFIKKFVQRNR